MGYQTYTKIMHKGKQVGKVFKSEKGKTEKIARRKNKINNTFWNSKQRSRGNRAVFVKVRKVK